jgi:hypothetical protein
VNSVFIVPSAVDWLVNVVWSLWSWVMGRVAIATSLVMALWKLLENALAPVNNELVDAVAIKPPWAGNELIVHLRPKL